MKQILITTSALAFLSISPVFATDLGCDINPSCQKNNSICEEINKDNKCFFDNQYKKMKNELGLNCNQEKKIDCYYEDLKTKMSSLKREISHEQKKLCSMIENDACKSEIKAKKKEIKTLKKEIKTEYQNFNNSVKSELCKDQIKKLNKFNRHERRKMRQLGKNCHIFRFPCTNKCSTKPSCTKPCSKPVLEQNQCNSPCNKQPKPSCNSCK